MIRNKLVMPLRGKTLTLDQLSQSQEQSEYLRGVLFSDSDCRLANPAGDVLHDLRITTRDFWRGVLESAGSIHMENNLCELAVENPRQARPRLRLRGSPDFMNHFRDFLEVELGDQWGTTRIPFDSTGRLARGAWNLQGQMVKQIIHLLYEGCIIARESFDRTADEIMAWESRAR